MKTAILGFGNPVRSDDGVGCFVIEQLRHTLPDSADVTLLDMGTSAFEVLFQLQGHSRIILLDAVVHSGQPDGTLFRLPASEVEAEVEEDPLVFLHALKWNQALAYARKILREDFPDDVQVYLIAVSDTRLEVGLSEVVRQAGARAARLISEMLCAVAPG